ncbi:MAG: 1-deoxy-D-xylulose-5-phosphate synthase [Spirochaetaceae bacterium]|nr:1-deoxy-D-xylulose-5-phosphate synthase [Spirochaetaceae bacterium]
MFSEESKTLLSQIKSPEDIKKLSINELKQVASEMRSEIISVVGKNGGHLASNLGVVELTIALHRVFSSPKDAFVWDVGHQCYPHKLLTGRYDKFDTLRKAGGISGFTKTAESEHDFFDSGHSSTSISSALGLLVGRDLQHVDGKVIAIIGDGALTGGMAFEALSHAGQLAKNLIVILNDNQMSISENTGSLSKYLSRLTMTSQYQSFRHRFDRMVKQIPFVNKALTDIVFRLKRGLKGIIFRNNLFVDFGFEYVGPLNGHSIVELETVLKRVAKLNRPVVVHVVTQKGRGYSPAENDPTTFHGVGPFCISDGTVEKFDTLSFTEAFSNAMVSLGEKRNDVAAVTAAMMKGSGLTTFAHRFPDRFFDVGIAEQHAVTFAGGLARAGIRPVVAIYSTFVQRSIDQVIHDIALQKAPIILALDRAGAVPDDGETHQGIFDISLFRPIPNMILIAPASAVELNLSLEWALSQNLPTVIRYPKSSCPTEQEAFALPMEAGRGVMVSEAEGAHLLFVCTGGIFPEVLEASRLLMLKGVQNDIYNLRFLKPLDKDYFLNIAARYDAVVFVEDGVRIGGIGTFLESLIHVQFPKIRSKLCGFPDNFIPQGKRSQILENSGLAPFQLALEAELLISKESEFSEAKESRYDAI